MPLTFPAKNAGRTLARPIGRHSIKRILLQLDPRRSETPFAPGGDPWSLPKGKGDPTGEYQVSVSPAQVTNAAESGQALQGAEIVVAAGAVGVTLLPQTIWSGHQTLRILADVNAVPPLGIEGIEPAWDGYSLAEGDEEHRDGMAIVSPKARIIFGALGIGALKKRTHYACLARLFERNDGVFDAEEIGAIAKELERECASSSQG